MLCSVVCVLACCCCCCCGLLLVIGVSAYAVSIALVLSCLLVACGTKFFFLSLSSSSPSLTPLCVHSKTSPCTFKTSRVYLHHAHTCFNMCAWCRYTRGRLTWFYSVPHHTPHRTHTPQTQDTTHHNKTPTTRHHTEPGTERHRERRQRKREAKTEEEIQDKRRQDKTKHKRRSRDQEKMKQKKTTKKRGEKR